MQSPIFTLLFLLSFFIKAQSPLPEFDGQITPEEWSGAETFDINYEIDQGNNVPSPHLTKVFIAYSKTKSITVSTFPASLQEGISIINSTLTCHFD